MPDQSGPIVHDATGRPPEDAVPFEDRPLAHEARGGIAAPEEPAREPAEGQGDIGAEVHARLEAESASANVGSAEPQPGSFRDRVRRRTREIAEQTTEIFPIPLYADFAAVELKVVTWASTEKSLNRNVGLNASVLNTMGDEIVAATVAFYEIQPTDSGFELEKLEGPASWKWLAQQFDKKVPDVAGERVGLVAVCSDQGVSTLSTTYRQWLNTRQGGLSRVAEAVRRDF